MNYKEELRKLTKEYKFLLNEASELYSTNKKLQHEKNYLINENKLLRIRNAHAADILKGEA